MLYHLRKPRLSAVRILAFVLFAIAGLSLLPSSPVQPQAAKAQVNLDEEIIYIDGNGFIRTLDVTQSGPAPITWVSPESGFIDFTTGDVNNDGDAEIIAIGGSGALGRLVIYDPVVSSPSIQPDGETAEGVPWKKLYERSLGATPGIVAAGDFDINIPGDEILYTFDVTEFSSYLVIIKGDSPTPDGTGWLEHVVVSYERTWDDYAVGQVDGTGTDEVVLIDSSIVDDSIKSRLAIYRIDDGGLANDSPFYSNQSSSNSWRGAAIGPVTDGGTNEVVAIRKTGPSGPANILIFQYSVTDGLAEDEDDAIFTNPRPTRLILANLNGVVNGTTDQEAVFLRDVNDIVDAIRLFVINRGNDSIDTSKMELSLDVDNGWQRGDGGDLDGNGDDEVVIMRPDAIRIYDYVPSGDEHLQQLGTDLVTSTNDKSIRVANLDTIGFQSGYAFTADVTAPVGGVAAGGTATWSVLLESSGQPVPFSAVLMENPDWVTQFNVSAATTPATLSLTVDAATLSPGTYNVSIQVSTTDANVTNNPYIIDIPVEVGPAAVNISPPAASFVYMPCTDTSTLEPRSVQLTVSGTTGINYTAIIAQVPTVVAAQELLQGAVTGARVNIHGLVELHDSLGNFSTMQVSPRIGIKPKEASSVEWPSGESWLSASSSVGEVGDFLTISIDPTELPEDVSSAEAMLILIADPIAGEEPENVRFVPITYLCAQTAISIPIAPRPDVVQ